MSTSFRRKAFLFGASGFIGREVRTSLEGSGYVVETAPGLRRVTTDLLLMKPESDSVDQLSERIAPEVRGSDVVINAAGIADPMAKTLGPLLGANVLLPVALMEASRKAEVPRFLHVSSAAVQGSREYLDESAEFAPITPYGESKMRAELALLEGGFGEGKVVIFRPTSVHAIGRRLTHTLARFAQSSFSSVAEPDAPTPQVLAVNTAAAITELCRPEPIPPAIVLQPSEGWTTEQLLYLFSGKQPARVSASIARPIVAGSRRLLRSGRAVAASRRLELLWFGQYQESGWLAKRGYCPPYGRDEWARLAERLRNGSISRPDG